MTSPSRRELPDEESSSVEPDGIGSILRRALSRGPSSEERLEELLAEHRKELEAQAARFDETVADLERREQLLRDSRASIERLLRLGTNDLEAKESNLADFVRELTEREEALHAREAELTRRRGELGAVELKRAAVEQREQALAAREERLSELEARLAEHDGSSVPDVPAPAETGVRLALVPGPSYRLVEIDSAKLGQGQPLEVDGKPYVVARIGPSPLPGDSRRCAYLVQE